MSCEDFQILINRDLDGVLRPEDEKRLSAHLAECGRCNSEQAGLLAMHGAFRDLRHVDVRPDLADQIIERAREPRTPVLQFPRYFLIPAAAAVLALCLVTGALGWHFHEPSTIRAAVPPRQDESKYRSFLVDQLALPADRVEAVMSVRHDFDRRFAAEKADLKQKEEALHRQELEEIWKLLPKDAQDRYRKHDPSFEPPHSPR